MENAESENSVTRRDFLARSGKIAGAVPAVTLLMSTTVIPGKAIAGYMDGPIIRDEYDDDEYDDDEEDDEEDDE
ncbi:hypothetical protein [Candidatus Halocynthiibacter alkanivorans]|uniref:hypothetical protein n=1 Tax=Candidatus Halocynthiibacter alkanivorans TaxID=2267619 RepID=UPI000DF2AB23|nr:hypothetical protein [Candidatus Halocynthiibacter alkanivorans]